MKARDHVERWLEDHQTVIGVAPIKWGRSDQHTEIFNAWYETEKHLVDICCWNHAYCLDIIALNKITKKEDFIVSGECDSEKGLTDRLTQFLSWLQSTK